VVNQQNFPPRDGLDQLFGASGYPFDETPAQPLTRREALAALPSRRELRGKGKSKGKAAKRRGASAPQSFTRPMDSAYPANRVIVVRKDAQKSIPRKRGSGVVTVLAVLGLFGSVALPAYAMGPLAVADSSTASLASTTGSLTVSEDAQVTLAQRGNYQATTAADLRNQRRTALMAANFEAYIQSGARELGDDYPWFSELSNNQGGGLSPLNYFYRECVDFVAWRLNRDAGSYSAPFKYVWSNLTPSGGNAYQWKRAWQKNGWETSTTPVAGAVAWYSYGHVAYVKSVNGDGTITVEDYNQSGMHVYDIRTVPENDAQLYLYPPPR
jgi:surface antigen